MNSQNIVRRSATNSVTPAPQVRDPGMMLDSLDPHFFNAAEPDQWWREQSHWPADSSWELHHLHAQRPRWSGSLPQWEAIDQPVSFSVVILVIVAVTVAAYGVGYDTKGSSP